MRTRLKVLWHTRRQTECWKANLVPKIKLYNNGFRDQRHVRRFMWLFRAACNAFTILFTGESNQHFAFAASWPLFIVLLSSTLQSSQK